MPTNSLRRRRVQHHRQRACRSASWMVMTVLPVVRRRRQRVTNLTHGHVPSKLRALSNATPTFEDDTMIRAEPPLMFHEHFYMELRTCGH